MRRKNARDPGRSDAWPAHNPIRTIAGAIERARELQIAVLARWLERRRTVTRLFAPVGPPRVPMVMGVDRGIG